jgi:hypothetical protein
MVFNATFNNISVISWRLQNVWCLFVLMVVNATFNNISVVLWRSVLLVEETGENHRPVTRHLQTSSHNVVHHALIEIRTHNISGDRKRGPGGSMRI